MDEYIQKLRYLLEQSNRDDKQAYFQYLLEMIEDMLEMGLSEEEIIANLGSVEDLVTGEEGNLNQIKYPLEVVNQKQYSNPDLSNAIIYKHSDIRKVTMDVINLILHVKQSDDLMYYIVSDTLDKLDISCHKGKLGIESKLFKGFNGNIDITLYIPKYHFIDKFSIEAVHGDIVIEEFENAQSKLDVDIVDGCFKLENSLLKEINIDSINSEVILDTIQAKIANVDSVSAPVSGNNINTDELNVETMGGDVNLLMADQRESYSLSIESPSIERNDHHAGGKPINIETLSGAIDVKFRL